MKKQRATPEFYAQFNTLVSAAMQSGLLNIEQLEFVSVLNEFVTGRRYNPCLEKKVSINSQTNATDDKDFWM